MDGETESVKHSGYALGGALLTYGLRGSLCLVEEGKSRMVLKHFRRRLLRMPFAEIYQVRMAK
jgi:hypothetical protein